MAEALPALVIMDTVLRAMNGIDLLKRMKQDQQLKTVPVIIHSSDDGPGVKERCMAAGCAAYFKKPADIEMLYKAIQLRSSSRRDRPSGSRRLFGSRSAMGPRRAGP